jgi:hypothetical protein
MTKISAKSLKEEEKEMALLDSDPLIKRSCLALDQELESDDTSRSKELSQILMRLFLPSVIACIWIPLIEFIAWKLFRILRSRYLVLLSLISNYLKKLYDTISAFFYGDLLQDYVFVYNENIVYEKEIEEKQDEKRRMMRIVKCILHPSVIRYIWSPLVGYVSSQMFNKFKYEIVNYVKEKKRYWKREI